ncbi:hypothetical protein K505DRAFT_389112 [Melanomma pulvis-pyrius CBS 109.77]|uniref:Uncharacterized protein n=1 Tax=Melanomma pulvis-pyrius CBS 109.77 TaxID=1314802 RepID=A0A6A6X4L7_9PLEO|nr:hypothetical protein K505DRAFT_389112 [Melanomma pulvis-pyrius CBS 109.77]
MVNHRTNTTHQAIFHLHDPSVIVELIQENHLKITIPTNSNYRFPYHWHLQKHGCHRITCLQGKLQLYTATPYAGTGISLISAGNTRNLRDGDQHAWGPAQYNSSADLVVLVEVDNADLYRNILSATLDASLFPRLASTPFWIRMLYSMLSWSPSSQDWLISALLWVQLQMMHCTHDFWGLHGSIDAPGWWLSLHPVTTRAPDWTHKIKWWSYTPISKVVQNGCYWVGRLFLGMKGEYAEYTPSTRSQRREGSGLSSRGLKKTNARD